MWEKIVERFLKLLCVKSIVTLVLTFVFATLALRGVITEVQVMAVFTTIIGFYFGTQVKKDGASNGT